MLTRVFNLTRREKPQTFPPRKRAMATSCFGQPDAEAPELDTFIVEDAGPPGTPLVAAGEQPVAPPQGGHQAPPQSSKEDAAPAGAAVPAFGAAPFGRAPAAALTGPPVEDAGLPLEQMRPKIQDGLLVVFGPDGDPVPPYAFARAAAARPDVLVGLPDGTTAPASRIAAALGAQILGRLGAANQGADWILTMLRDGGPPEDASEHAPGTRHDVLTPEALPRLELDLEELVASAEASLDLDFSADRFAAELPGCAPGDTPLLSDLADLPHETVAPAATDAERDVDPDSIVLVLMRGVPEDAVLSTGIRDDDGTWSISPLDLSTVTISLPSQGSGEGAAGAGRDADRDLSITGIALAENGELVAISETVPLADYLATPMPPVSSVKLDRA
jgi:hypothetical protein